MLNKLIDFRQLQFIQLMARRCRGFGVCVVALLFIGVLSGSARVLAASESQEYESKIKAAYLYNFTKFIKWPSRQINGQDQADFNICILGQDPLGTAIDTLKGKATTGALVAVKHIDTVPQPNQCQVLFISRSEKPQLTRVLQEVAEQSVLTVSDMEGFVAEGGCIELATIKGKVIFNINLQSAERAQLKMSAQLLELAKVVIDK